MKKNLIIITEKSGIIIRSLQVQLIRQNLDVVVCYPDVNAIEKYLEKGYTNILLDEESFIKREVYVFLKDGILDQKFNLFAIADTSNNLNESNLLSNDMIKRIFFHPIAPAELAVDLSALCEEPVDKKHKILVFDKSDNVCRILSGWLKGKYDVRCTNKSIRTFQELLDYKPDLLIMDNDLPDIPEDIFFQLYDSEWELKNTHIAYYVDYLKDEPTHELVAIMSKEIKRESFLENIKTIFENT